MYPHELTLKFYLLNIVLDGEGEFGFSRHETNYTRSQILRKYWKRDNKNISHIAQKHMS